MELAIKKENELSLAEKCFQSPVLLKQNEFEIKVFLLNLISKTVLHSGQKQTENEKKVLTDEFFKELSIMPKFKNLTAKEIETSFYKGVRSEYGDFYGLNVVTFTKWVKSFLESEFRAKKIIEATQSKFKPDDIDPEKAHKEYLEVCIYKAYEDYLSSKYFKCTDWSGVYKVLWSNGYCKFTESVLKEIKKEAEQMVKDELAVKRLQDPMNKSFLNQLREIQKGNIDEKSWKYQARKISVIKQMDMFKEMEMNIKELVK